MKNNSPILLVEDDEVGIMTTKRALKIIKSSNPLNVARNGEEALKFLQNSNNTKPGIILLDINMPRMNGLEFLKIIKQDIELKRIPVIILTTSQENFDKYESFGHGIAGYLVKPISFDDFIEMIKAVKSYWTLSEQPVMV